MWVLVLQRMLLEFIWDIIYFPLWWYSGGTKRALIGSYHLWQDGNIQLAPGLWLKNIFVPMFGQYSFEGRLVSFFVRLANVIIRSVGLLIWTIVVLILFSLWLVFPIFVAYMLFYSLF